MGRLLTTIAVTITLLVGLDRAVPYLTTPSTAVQAINIAREKGFRQAMLMHFNELRADNNRLVTSTYARWASVPDRKPNNALRVVVIGNSAAMDSLAPWVVEERLAAAFPTRDVTVIPLILPGIRVADELVLVRAALAKHADVIILTPNLKGLIEGPSALSGRTRALFGMGLTSLRAPEPVAVVEGFLERYWQLYRARAELRARLIGEGTRLLSWEDASVQENREVQQGFAEIAAAATRGDMRALLETYRLYGLSLLIGGDLFRQRLSDSSPVFDTVARLAAEVRAGQAIGIAIFLPVNPIFRDATATAGFEALHVDDAYIQALSARTLAIYRAAGFTTFDRVDALPAAAFIDLVHVNADGMEAFSREMATSLVEALRPSM